MRLQHWRTSKIRHFDASFVASPPEVFVFNIVWWLMKVLHAHPAEPKRTVRSQILEFYLYDCCSCRGSAPAVRRKTDATSPHIRGGGLQRLLRRRRAAGKLGGGGSKLMGRSFNWKRKVLCKQPSTHGLWLWPDLKCPLIQVIRSTSQRTHWRDRISRHCRSAEVMLLILRAMQRVYFAERPRRSCAGNRQITFCDATIDGHRTSL